MLKQIIIAACLLSSNLCSAQLLEFMEIDSFPTSALFRLLEKDSTAQVVVEIDQPIISLPNKGKIVTAWPSSTVERSPVDGMPIKKPYFNTKNIPEYDYGADKNYSILKRDERFFEGIKKE